jgi:putative transposase
LYFGPGAACSSIVLIPMLYLKGVSTGDFEEALLAGGLSASTIGRLKEVY